MAVQELMRGLPPWLSQRLDKMDEDKRNGWITFIAKEDRKGKREHSSYRRFVLKQSGVDVGPYEDAYSRLWRYEENRKTALGPELVILGLDSQNDLTKRDVYNAYRRKARKAHPDVGGNAEDFNRLYTAYRTVLLCAK